MSVPSIAEVVAPYQQTDANAAVNWSGLQTALIAREDAMADTMRLAGMQFGLYPEIIAEVFADVGIGTPLDETQRAFIRQQFVTLMENLRQQHEGH